MHKATFYLALSESQRWPYLSARIAIKRPALRAGEIAMELNIEIPKALFKRPTLRAEIELDMLREALGVPYEPHQSLLERMLEAARGRAGSGAAPEPPAQEPMTAEQVASACVTYRHDFGLLPEVERHLLMAEARRWAAAFGMEVER